MAAKALLDANPDPTEEDVRWALSGNLCRCTGYQNIVKSVLWAAAKLNGAGSEPGEACGVAGRLTAIEPRERLRAGLHVNGAADLPGQEE